MVERLEEATQRIGQELFDSLPDRRPSLWRPEGWRERLLEHAMSDEDFKVRLFRFVDVFPTLADRNAVAEHVQQYFPADGGGFPPGWALRLSRPESPLSGAAAGIVSGQVRSMAERFIAGRDAEAAWPTLEDLRRRNMSFTLDVLGEATLSEVEARRYQDRYLNLLEELSRRVAEWPARPILDRSPWGEIPRLNLSLKATALYSQLDPADFDGSRRAVTEALRPIFHQAAASGAFLNLDLEQFAYRSLTEAIFQHLLLEPDFRSYPSAGIVVQAYLRDSRQHLEDLLAWVRRRGTPITVRLVKGAYWDYETVIAAQEHWPVPVFTEKRATDARFEELTDFLMEHWQELHPAIASHNVRSLAHAMAWVEEGRVPRDAVEIQILHGMAEPVKEAVVARGYRLREYVPVGEVVPGMAYLVRRLLENTSNDSFLRQSFVEHEERQILLASPRAAAEAQEGPPAMERVEVVGRPPVAATDPSSPGPFVNTPHADFAVEANRREMQAALEHWAELPPKHHPLIIAGKERQTEALIHSHNPAEPAKRLGSVGSASVEDADDAVEEARRRFPEWRDTPPQERAAVLFRAAEIMRRRRFYLSALEILEAGKPWREADGDVTEGIDFLEYYGREMLRLAEPRALHDVPGERDFYLYEPRGPAAVIAPWNFPLAILAGMTSAALVAGNPVIMKPANPTPLIAWELFRAFREAGLPEGVLAFLPGPGASVGAHLVKHPQIEVIAFTGSRSAGLKILSQAARVRPGQSSIKRVIAELGGKNAVIVDEDADLDVAVEGTLTSAFFYSGQKCSACSRTIVVGKAYETFVPRLLEAAASLKVGDPRDPGVKVGPVINQEAFDKIHGYIEQGRKEARLALAAPVPGGGYFVGPHVFVDVPRDGIIAREEIFGPVLSLFRAQNFAQAIEMAVDSEYALTGGLYSRSPEHIELAYREFRVGNLYVNRGITGTMVGRQPFGGFKLSGVGSKAGGPDYLRQFLEPRTITENTMRRGFAPS